MAGHLNAFLSLSIPFLSALPLRFDTDALELLRGAAVVQQGRHLHPSQQGKRGRGRTPGTQRMKASYGLSVVEWKRQGVGILESVHPQALALGRSILLPWLEQ